MPGKHKLPGFSGIDCKVICKVAPGFFYLFSVGTFSVTLVQT